MTDQAKQGLATRSIHNRREYHDCNSPFTPIYNTTNYLFESTQQLRDTIEGKREGYLYTRWGHNPTIAELEQGLARLEYAEAALAFAAGAAAISATLLAHGRKGVVVVGSIYGGTHALLTQQFGELGIPVKFVDYEHLGDLANQLQTGQVVYCETPANPTLRLLDLTALAKVAHSKQAKLVVDNTFASPVNQNPLVLGADIVVHSATKYLGGHSDLTAGAVMASKELLKPVAAWRKSLGQLLSPQTAALLSRSMRTLLVRVERHNANALAVAKAMQQHPKIEKVYYPGLPDNPDFALAQQQMHGFGGMVSIDVKGSREAAEKVADNLHFFLLATSLGGVESLVSQPCATSHHAIPAEERHRQGISDGMLRLSVGIENVEDLIADLNQALDSI